MFISLKYSGTNRHDQQIAAGLFLILMQPDVDSVKYPHHSDRCAQCDKTRDQHSLDFTSPCPQHGIVARLRAIGQAKRDNQSALVDEVLARESYVPGCAACAAHQAYAAECHSFTAIALRHPLRAIVRYVRMHQLGHFMMGSARVGKTRLSLSGSYGSDGLPKSVPDDVYEAGLPLPPELYDAWNHGGGWNGAGNEREAMTKWAEQNLITRRT